MSLNLYSYVFDRNFRSNQEVVWQLTFFLFSATWLSCEQVPCVAQSIMALRRENQVVTTEENVNCCFRRGCSRQHWSSCASDLPFSLSFLNQNCSFFLLSGF